MNRITTLFGLSILLIATAFADGPPPGRLAYIADGNSPDPDDIGANAATLALLRATGNEKRLIHFSHSCDLVRNQSISARMEIERQRLMQVGAEKTARLWGGFEHLSFWNFRTQLSEGVLELRDAINASSEEDPLWIIMAGESDVIWFALRMSAEDKRKHVIIITHHPANDNAGDFHKLHDVTRDFPVTVARIPDQNIKLKVAKEEWDWARDHEDPRIQVIWEQGDIAERDDVVRFQKGYFDISDAGMTYYWVTGATSGGKKQASVEDFKSALLNGLK